MTPRVSRLRQESLDTRPTLSVERAVLVTEAMEQAKDLPPPIQRAMVFRHVLEHKHIHIGEGELIVGERGPDDPGAAARAPRLLRCRARGLRASAPSEHES